MELLENISEYYDELFPISSDQKKFYEEETACFSKPVKYLRVGCGTGLFEHQLSKDGSDVTGIETVSPLLESANRRRRTQLMSIRFFQMTNLEMARFLGKGFYNVISILDNRLIFTHDKILMEKLFFDCKQLLSENGKLVLSLTNFTRFDMENGVLPTKESIRVKLYTRYFTKDEKTFLEQSIETGSGKILPVTRDAEIFAITSEQISDYAKKVGFKNIEFYSDFGKSAFTCESENLVCVLS